MQSWPGVTVLIATAPPMSKRGRVAEWSLAYFQWAFDAAAASELGLVLLLLPMLPVVVVAFLLGGLWGGWWVAGPVMAMGLVPIVLLELWARRQDDLRGARLEIAPQRVALKRPHRPRRNAELVRGVQAVVRLGGSSADGLHLQALGHQDWSGHVDWSGLVPLAGFDVEEVRIACLTHGWTWMSLDGMVTPPPSAIGT